VGNRDRYLTSRVAALSPKVKSIARAAYSWRVIYLDTLVSAVASGLCFVWRLIPSMIDLLAEGVSLRYGKYLVTYPAAAIPSNDYYLSCKYQSDLSGTPRLSLLMIL
jgi:hypothetical protein